MIKLGNDTQSNTIKGIVSQIDGLREKVDTIALKFSGYSADDKIAVAEEMGVTVEQLQAIINSFSSWKNAINGISCAYVSDLIYLSKNVR